MKKNAVTGIITILLTAMIAVSVCPISASAVDGRSLSEYYGFSYGSYMDYLYSHEHDNYYLGTPYRSGNWRSPNGDTSYNGSSGMNCSGFVWHVLKSCILRAGGDPSDYQILSFSTPRGREGRKVKIECVRVGKHRLYMFREPDYFIKFDTLIGDKNIVALPALVIKEIFAVIEFV